MGGINGDADVEEVSMDVDNTNREAVDGDQEMEEPQQMQDVPESVAEQQSDQLVQKTKLKDLFALREEDGSYSSLIELQK